MTSSAPTRAEILNSIADASLTGYLCLFVGTGFSKAATGELAPSFEELIRRLVDKLDLSIDIDSGPECRLKSHPQVVSLLVDRLTTKEQVARERAEAKLREEVANICNLSPTPTLRSQLASSLCRVGPSWVITTNYDLILETLLEDATSVLPEQPLIARPDRVPIYHLHGHRRSPSSIKVTEEDYVGLVGPIDYQRLKLPLILTESTTLMLEYALGDINVRAAIEWSRSFRSRYGLCPSTSQGLVIQALFKPLGASPWPYVGPTGEVILEISDLSKFLDELADYCDGHRQTQTELRALIAQFLSSAFQASVIGTPSSARDTFLDIIQKALPLSRPTLVIDFLGRALDPIWQQARADNGFTHYNIYLLLLLDVFERLDLRHAFPTLIHYLADALERVGWFIRPGRLYGSAWDATDTWLQQHSRIPEPVRKELLSYATSQPRIGLQSLFALVSSS